MEYILNSNDHKQIIVLDIILKIRLELLIRKYH